MSTETSEKSNICSSCRAELAGAARFCPQCGSRTDCGPLKFGPLQALAVILLAALLWGGAIWIKSSKAGIKPTKTMAEVEGISKQPAAPDPELDRLRASAAKTPNDAAPWLALGEELGRRIDGVVQPDSDLIFELIDVLKKVIELTPKDPRALLMMADLSFNQTAFTKAAEYYERYLAEQPVDLDARAKLGSSLIFLGDHERAVNELTEVLKSNPKHFHALAYLAISYAQAGNTKKAREQGKLAIAQAPNDEAKARLDAFLASLDDENTAKKNAKSADPGIVAVSAYLQKNPIAGPKFKGSELKDDTLALYFKDFPMADMPEVAKEKFFAGLKATVPVESKITTLSFVDMGSGEEMAKIATRE